jgi:hypothetical protein
MSTGEVDEKKAERALKLKLQERDAELGGGRKMVLPKQERFRVSELLDNLESDYRLRKIASPQFKSHLWPLVRLLPQSIAVRRYLGRRSSWR